MPKLRGMSGVLFATAFAAIGAYLLVSTHAATTEQPSVSWKGSNSQLINRNANLCLGTPGNTKPATGTKTVIESCSTVNSETWSLTWGSGTIKTTTVVNGYGQCLDDQGSSAGVGTAVKIAACTAGSNAQAWTTGYGDGTIRIDELCLGVSGNSQAANTSSILTPCNTPVPSAKLTSPASGGTVSGTAIVTASASISQDSIAKITLQAGSTVLNTCTNAASCSAKWNTKTVSDGTYTLTAVATGSLGGTATASETVKSSNPSPPSGGSGGGNPGDNGGGSTGGDISVCDPSDPTCNDDSDICDPSDPTCADDTSTCDPSDPTCSADDTACDPSDPTCTDASTDTTGDSGSSNSQTGRHSPTTKNKNTSEKLSPGKTSVKRVVGVSALCLALIIIGFLVFLYLRRRKLANIQPVNSSDDFFAHIAPPASTTPGTAPPPNSPPVAQPAQAIPVPNSPLTPARSGSNWWEADGGQHLAQPANLAKEADQPPDMFEEGRKRLEEESKDGRLKF